jgi:ATP-dependent exoDNAse (exonuclease V) beta subunit
LLLDEPIQAPQPPPAPPVADAHQRAQALDPRRSFIVQAPAGSGKTGLLIQRFLVLLARVAKPEEVVALTFTRKAAGEMRGRVLAALRAAREGVEPESDHAAHTLRLAAAVLERDASQGWGLETNPNRLQVQTIDSLCVGLAERLPLLSGLGPSPQIREDAWELYREAARETLGLLEEAPYAQRVAPLLLHVDNDVAAAEELLAGLLGKRDQWRRHLRDGAQRADLERALENLCRERMQQAREAVPEVFAGAILAAVRYAAANVAPGDSGLPLSACADLDALPGAQLEDLERWRGIAELFLTVKGTLRKRLDKRSGFLSAGEGSPEERKQRKQAKEHAEELLDNLVVHQDFVAALHEIRLLPPAAYDERQWAFIEALSALLPIALAQLELTFRQRGALDFVALTLAAIQALGEADAPTDLALALDYRIQHLLIDEFQDTSLSQFELLLRLTAGWQPDDGRTVFAVGDPMQSIYRFREAEVGLFLRARHAGLGSVTLQPLALSVNFRAQAGLVEWVNDVFARVLPAREDPASGAVPFSASSAQEPALPGNAVQIHAFVPADRAGEAQRVLDVIAQARGQDPQGSIALLVRGRGHLVEIVPRLRDAGLRFRAIEIEELSGRAAVRDLYALTRAVLHPADRTAWLSVLRAPWCGLTLSDLETLVDDDRAGVLWARITDLEVRAGLSPDGAGRLARVVAALEPVLGARGRGPLRNRVEAAWLRLGGPACAGELADVEDALVFLDLVEELEQGGDLEDFAALDERLAKLFALPDTQAPQTLQVMTIHKSKGLEFDTVIVPGLGYRTGRDDLQLLQWLERPNAAGGSDLLLGALSEQGRDEDPVYSYVARLHRERQRQEDGRLLYVAVTRARQGVHLMGHAELDEKTAAAREPDDSTLLARLWPVLAPEFDAAARRSHSVQHDVASDSEGSSPGAVQARPIPQSIQRLVSDWQAPAVAAAVRWQAPAPSAPEERLPAVEFDWASETARRVGTVVHRYLQRIAEEGVARWDTARLAALQPALIAALRGTVVPASELARAGAQAAEALRGVLADPRGRWILDSGHAEATSELRLSAQLDDRVVQVAIDRTFVDAQGTRWIVDYKTGTHEGGDLEAFLDREQARYREQLEVYARIMAGLDSRPVRLALYFPLLRAWREWAP